MLSCVHRLAVGSYHEEALLCTVWDSNDSFKTAGIKVEDLSLMHVVALFPSTSSLQSFSNWNPLEYELSTVYKLFKY